MKILKRLFGRKKTPVEIVVESRIDRLSPQCALLLEEFLGGELFIEFLLEMEAAISPSKKEITEPTEAINQAFAWYATDHAVFWAQKSLEFEKWLYEVEEEV
jgi:hypothetical protein